MAKYNVLVREVDLTSMDEESKTKYVVEVVGWPDASGVGGNTIE